MLCFTVTILRLYRGIDIVLVSLLNLLIIIRQGIMSLSSIIDFYKQFWALSYQIEFVLPTKFLQGIGSHKVINLFFDIFSCIEKYFLK